MLNLYAPIGHTNEADVLVTKKTEDVGVRPDGDGRGTMRLITPRLGVFQSNDPKDGNDRIVHYRDFPGSAYWIPTDTRARKVSIAPWYRRLFGRVTGKWMIHVGVKL